MLVLASSALTLLVGRQEGNLCWEFNVPHVYHLHLPVSGCCRSCAEETSDKVTRLLIKTS